MFIWFIIDPSNNKPETRKHKMTKILPTSHGVIGSSADYNDCTVRAAVNATGFDYEMIYSALRHYGRPDKKCAMTGTIAKAYKELGMKLEGVFGTTSAAISSLYDLQQIFGKENVKHFAGMTLKRFIAGRLKGSYVCCSNNHAFAVVNGKLIDKTALSSGIRIIFFF